MNNVIDFKNEKEKREYFDIDDPENFEILTTDLALQLSNEVMDSLSELGYPMPNDETLAYDLMLLVESVKSIIYKAEGVSYPMHSVVQEIFTIENPKELIEEFFAE